MVMVVNVDCRFKLILSKTTVCVTKIISNIFIISVAYGRFVRIPPE